MVNNGLPPIHPGAFLQETLHELGVSQAQFAPRLAYRRCGCHTLSMARVR